MNNHTTIVWVVDRYNPIKIEIVNSDDIGKANWSERAISQPVSGATYFKVAGEPTEILPELIRKVKKSIRFNIKVVGREYLKEFNIKIFVLKYKLLAGMISNEEYHNAIADDTELLAGLI